MFDSPGFDGLSDPLDDFARPFRALGLKVVPLRVDDDLERVCRATTHAAAAQFRHVKRRRAPGHAVRRHKVEAVDKHGKS